MVEIKLFLWSLPSELPWAILHSLWSFLKNSKYNRTAHVRKFPDYESNDIIEKDLAKNKEFVRKYFAINKLNCRFVYICVAEVTIKLKSTSYVLFGIHFDVMKKENDKEKVV